MKVLFVSSGNSKSFQVAPFIKAQAESLKIIGVDVQFFTINQKGIKGYIKESIRLRRYLKKHQSDLIHAHYTLSGWTAVLSFSRVPTVLSLMGDDANGTYIRPGKISLKSRFLMLLTIMIQPFLSAVISKSKHISNIVWQKNKRHIIPNGINLEKFPIKNLQGEINPEYDKELNKILFLGDKSNRNKNFALCNRAVSIIDQSQVKLVAPFPIPHAEVTEYLVNADVFVLSSFMEGSPNVVKEAMACNCPVVATDVGDVRWLFGDTPGHYIASFEPEDYAEKIKLAIQFRKEHGQTRGRERLLDLGLDAETVAKRIIDVYKKVLS